MINEDSKQIVRMTFSLEIIIDFYYAFKKGKRLKVQGTRSKFTRAIRYIKIGITQNSGNKL